jgi:hypothetical protein
MKELFFEILFSIQNRYVGTATNNTYCLDKPTSTFLDLIFCLFLFQPLSDFLENIFETKHRQVEILKLNRQIFSAHKIVTDTNGRKSKAWRIRPFATAGKFKFWREFRKSKKIGGISKS